MLKTDQLPANIKRVQNVYSSNLI